MFNSTSTPLDANKNYVKTPWLTLLLFVCMLWSVAGQAQETGGNGPGGVNTDLRIWLLPDVGFTASRWEDYSGNDNSYTQTNTNRQPFVADRLFNFNPVIDFGGTGSDARFMVVPDGKPYTDDNASSTIFVVNLTRDNKALSDIIGFGSSSSTSVFGAANLPVVTKNYDDIVILPFTTDPGLPKVELNRLYLDDVSFTTRVKGIKYGKNGQLATVNNTMTTLSLKQKGGSVLGAQTEETNGMIGEVIAFERDLTEAEKQKVRTYVAIKYGITLAHHYVASNGAAIFLDQSINNGYNNNIAGIARDDNGSLYQRQSRSINTGEQVIISTPGLGATNLSNTGSLNNNEYLMCGDNGLLKNPNIAFSGDHYRFPAIWKVQSSTNVGTVRVYWRKGFSDMILIQSTDENFDSSDWVTPMNNIQLIGGVEYVYADASFANGSYFTFAATLQSPGGVGRPVVWLKANAGLDNTEHQSHVYSWVNYGTSAKVAVPEEAKSSPSFEWNTHNFNPAIVATSGHNGLLLANVFPGYSHRPLSSFVIQSQNDVSLVKPMISFGNNTVVADSKDKPWFGSSISRLRLYWYSGYTETSSFAGSAQRTNKIPSINAYYMPQWVSNPHTTVMSLDGVTATVSGSSSASGGIGQHLMVLTDGGHNSTSEGSISEVISYDRELTELEKLKINSYLAIKYGITLLAIDGNGASDYIDSKGNIIWNAAYTVFNNNIAGIGNDFASGLDQKQSKSVYKTANDQLIVSVGNLAFTNDKNRNSLKDGAFLIWGDNGNTQTLTAAYTSFNYDGGVNNGRRMNRIWRYQNTNITETIKFYFPKESIGTTTLPSCEECAGYALIMADDAGITSNVRVYPLRLSADGLYYEATPGLNAAEGYFTYGKVSPLNTGKVYLPLNTVKRTVMTILVITVSGLISRRKMNGI